MLYMSGVAVYVQVSVMVGVAVNVPVSVIVGVLVLVSETVSVAVIVYVGVFVKVSVILAVDVTVGENVDVAVNVPVGAADVAVLVCTGVAVALLYAVCGDDGSLCFAHAQNVAITATMHKQTLNVDCVNVFIPFKPACFNNIQLNCLFVFTDSPHRAPAP